MKIKFEIQSQISLFTFNNIRIVLFIACVGHVWDVVAYKIRACLAKFFLVQKLYLKVKSIFVKNCEYLANYKKRFLIK